MVCNSTAMNVQRSKTMISSSSSSRRIHRSLWLIFCCVFLFTTNNNSQNTSVAARPLNSIQLATGEWDVSIRGGFWTNPSDIFPSVAQSEDETTILPFVRKRPWGRSSMDCILSMASDGTFVLTPKYVETKDSDEKEEYKTRNHDLVADDREEPNPLLLDLRGSWNVLANPYCVTDRYYDQVSLRSYPRQKTTTTQNEHGSHQVSPAFQLVLNCRMWGRHKRLSRRKQGTYRMTHGTLVCKERNVPWWKHFGRPLVGSFSAVRSSNQPKHQGWLDEEELGYSMD